MSWLGEALVEETIHAKALWQEELGTEGAGKRYSE